MKAKLSTVQAMLNVLEKTAGNKEADKFEQKIIKKNPTPAKNKGGQAKEGA